METIIIDEDEEPETRAERMLRALVLQLLKSGKLDETDLFEAADALDAEGDEDGAHQLRILPIIAGAPSQSDWEVNQRRKSMRIVPNGGNEPD